MKRLSLILALILCFALVFASCGEAVPEPSSSEPVNIQQAENSQASEQSETQTKDRATDTCILDLKAMNFKEAPSTRELEKFAEAAFCFLGEFSDANLSTI